ncbi:thioesterase family protein [Arthrobacter sp. M4]|uniref:acyl-CoA thioesterase n=1 Tax=Arthrobacter sp. M4 TaxID=218160 RepID=UPI001CDC102E|nr:acyl-CoA thioesterase [Arthrobacter sp. M4]MCA4134827.1 acyl-CoA thioesterase [Arthrobacter sp. M4]
MRALHVRHHRVVLGDVDSAGVVYFASVFRWHEHSFSEWLAERYEPLGRILGTGSGLPVVASSAEYPAAIHQDDVLTLQSWATEVKRSSFLFGTTMLREGTLTATVTTRHVWTRRNPDGDFSSTELPPSLRMQLSGP